MKRRRNIEDSDSHVDRIVGWVEQRRYRRLISYRPALSLSRKAVSSGSRSHRPNRRYTARAERTAGTGNAANRVADSIHRSMLLPD